jgi:hypothetical protein
MARAFAGVGERLRGVVGARRGPRVAFTKADAARLNEAFARLDRSERRAILRAVNRGQQLPDRRSAELAVGIARRQQRFWRRAWLLGPVIAAIQAAFTPIGLQEMLLLGAWGTLVLGMMAFWWWSRARRAEELNVALIARRGGRSTGRPSGASGDGRPRSRLPGGPALPVTGGSNGSSGRDVGAADAPDARADGDTGPGGLPEDGPRPPRPRGRKRR